jgi:[protein-PII] uridylyltransferase
MDARDATNVVTVAAPDKVGLLALVAGVLSLNRLNVLAARVTTVNGRAVQEWTVRPAFGDPPSIEQLSGDVRRAVEGTYDVGARLEKRDADYARPSGTAHPQPVVTAATDGSQGVTFLEIRAHDAPGLLYRVATALTTAHASIVGAKVSTLGSDAVDVFFVTDSEGRELTDDRIATLRSAVLSSLA